MFGGGGEAGLNRLANGCEVKATAMSDDSESMGMVG